MKGYACYGVVYTPSWKLPKEVANYEGLWRLSIAVVGDHVLVSQVK
jgi:hypothetical protein